MTDHSSTHSAIAHAHKSPFSVLADRIRLLVRHWRARRAVARLAEFDDYMLSDIGVSRLDVEWAAGLPLTINAALTLEERARHRRAGRIRS